MVTGQFRAAGRRRPGEVADWYLAVYADAYEWVELPNTLRHGHVRRRRAAGSKPYAASGNYINRMSDYLRGLPLRREAKTGEDACPFNSLYWDFMLENSAPSSAGNPRLAMPYRTLDRLLPSVRRPSGATAPGSWTASPPHAG